ncbi:unnamed protein product [Cyprideis torosa]|uniref:Uncharacterized protein n=1 Tax=Cyprideis torosa TaxID=163714 RepID=A0A7R8WCQ2_9CRUS|nr:unnamed protein product [Cyprideis torosa]CAG0893646.1 unnamed protein product [Cyprideis torosa]
MALASVIGDLCEFHEGQVLEAKDIREHWLKPRLNTFFDLKVLKGSLEISENFLNSHYFKHNLKALNTLHRQFVVGEGELDEVVFLRDDVDSILGAGVSDGNNHSTTEDEFHTAMAVRKSQMEEQGGDTSHHPTGSLVPSTPLTGRMYLKPRLPVAVDPENDSNPTTSENALEVATENLAHLSQMLSEEENPASVEEVFGDWSDKSLIPIMREKLVCLRSAFEAAFAHQLTSQGATEEEQLTKKRADASEKLCLRLLKRMLSAERKIVNGESQLKMLVSHAQFLPSVFAVSLEIVLSTHCAPSRSHWSTFPWVLKALDLAPFFFYRVIEIVFRVDDFTRDVVKHLNWVEESVLESFVWRSESPLWEKLRQLSSLETEQVSQLGTLHLDENATADGQPSLSRAVPLCADVLLPSMIQDAPAPEPLKTALLDSPKKDWATVNLSDRFSSPVKAIVPTTTWQRGDLNREKPSEAGSVEGESSKQKGSLALFFRKFYYLASVRLRHLLERLGIAETALHQKIWTCIEETVSECDKSFTNIMHWYRLQPQAASHVYRSVLLRRILPEEKDSVENDQNNSGSEEKSIDGVKQENATEERCDLIKFYNQVFHPELKNFALKFIAKGSKAQRLHHPPLSPMPSNKRASPTGVKRKISANHEVYVRPYDPEHLQKDPPSVLFQFSKSPMSMDLSAINKFVRLSCSPAEQKRCGDEPAELMRGSSTRKRILRDSPDQVEDEGQGLPTPKMAKRLEHVLRERIASPSAASAVGGEEESSNASRRLLSGKNVSFFLYGRRGAPSVASCPTNIRSELFVGVLRIFAMERPVSIQGGLGGAFGSDSQLPQGEVDLSKVPFPDLSKCRGRRRKLTYSCDMCGLKFNRKYNFERHLRSHTGEKPFDCKFCGRTFSDASGRDRHHLLHEGKHRQIECPLCSKKMRDKWTLENHLRKHTGERPFVCSCGSRFRKMSSLRAHVRRKDAGGCSPLKDPAEGTQGVIKKGRKPRESLSARLSVKMCQTTQTGAEGECTRPEATLDETGAEGECTRPEATLDETSVDQNHSNSNGIPGEHSRVMEYMCCFCPKRFSEPNALRFHVGLDHLTPDDTYCPMNAKLVVVRYAKEGIRFACRYCPNQHFPLEEDLMDHITTVHRPPSNRKGITECHFCSRVFEHFQRLSEHLEEHRDQTRHICPYCELRFLERRSLSRHLQIHVGACEEEGGAEGLPPRLSPVRQEEEGVNGDMTNSDEDLKPGIFMADAGSPPPLLTAEEHVELVMDEEGAGELVAVGRMSSRPGSSVVPPECLSPRERHVMNSQRNTIVWIFVLAVCLVFFYMVQATIRPSHSGPLPHLVISSESEPLLRKRLGEKLRKRVTIHTGVEGGTLSSTLLIKRLELNDFGIFVCEAQILGEIFLHEFVHIVLDPGETTVGLAPVDAWCPSGHFKCSSGECLHQMYVCDNVPDCDGDEDEDMCGPDVCEKKLSCMDGRCLAPSVCCFDGSVNSGAPLASDSAAVSPPPPLPVDRSNLFPILPPNCSSITTRIPCCFELFKHESSLISPELVERQRDVNHSTEIDSLEQTVFTTIGMRRYPIPDVTGCGLAFLIMIVIMAVAICRINLRRAAIVRSQALALRNLPQDRHLDEHLLGTFGGAGRSSGSGEGGPQVVTYNINNGVQWLTGNDRGDSSMFRSHQRPPSYSEAVRATFPVRTHGPLPPHEGPPPPYQSTDDLSAPLPPSHQPGGPPRRLRAGGDDDANGNSLQQDQVEENNNVVSQIGHLTSPEGAEARQPQPAGSPPRAESELSRYPFSEGIVDLLWHLEPMINSSTETPDAQALLDHVQSADPRLTQYELRRLLKKCVRQWLDPVIEEEMEGVASAGAALPTAGPQFESLASRIAGRVMETDEGKTLAQDLREFFESAREEITHGLETVAPDVAWATENHYLLDGRGHGTDDTSDLVSPSQEDTISFASLDGSLNQSSVMFLTPDQYQLISRNLHPRLPHEVRLQALDMLFTVSTADLLANEKWCAQLRMDLQRACIADSVSVVSKAIRFHGRLLSSQSGICVKEGVINLCEALLLGIDALSGSSWENGIDLNHISVVRVCRIAHLLVEALGNIAKFWVRMSAKFVTEIIHSCLDVLDTLRPENQMRSHKYGSWLMFALVDPFCCWFRVWMRGAFARNRVVDKLSRSPIFVSSLLSAFMALDQSQPEHQVTFPPLAQVASNGEPHLIPTRAVTEAAEAMLISFVGTTLQYKRSRRVLFSEGSSVLLEDIVGKLVDLSLQPLSTQPLVSRCARRVLESLCFHSRNVQDLFSSPQTVGKLVAPVSLEGKRVVPRQILHQLEEVERVSAVLEIKGRILRVLLMWPSVQSTLKNEEVEALFLEIKEWIEPARIRRSGIPGLVMLIEAVIPILSMERGRQMAAETGLRSEIDATLLRLRKNQNHQKKGSGWRFRHLLEDALKKCG